MSDEWADAQALVIHHSSFITCHSSLINVNRNRRIFIVVFIFFTVIVALFAIDMASRTTAPWNKRRELERALPTQAQKNSTTTDTLAADTLLTP